MEATLKKQAALINKASDIGFLQDMFFSEETYFLVRDYKNKVILDGEKVENFYEDSTGSTLEMDQISYMGLKWHRDDQGIDLLSKNGISPAPIFFRRTTLAFTIYFRLYKTIKYWLTKVETLYFSRNETTALKRVLNYFPGRIEWYDSTNHNAKTSPYYPTNHFHVENYPWLVLDGLYRIHSLSKLARLIQMPFMSYIRRKRKFLFVSDWTNKKTANKRTDTLISNSLLPWKGYYLRLDPKWQKEGESVFPKKLDETYLNVERLRNVLGRIDAHWDDELIQMFIDTCIESYDNNRSIIIRAYAMFQELFSYYKPSLVAIPSETAFFFIAAGQIARQRGIKSLLIIDGYASVEDKSIFCYDETGNDFIFTNYAAFGEAHLDLLSAWWGIDRNKCILIEPPIINLHKELPTEAKKYDALVVAFNPNITNPQANWDPGKMILDTVRVLLDVGMTNLAIRLKPGDKFIQENELKTFFLRENIIDHKDRNYNIDYLTGNFFYEHVLKAKCVVGQITTAILETIYHDIPYYIYEPYENGKTDEMIKSSMIFNLDTVARNTGQLKKLLCHKTASVRAKKNYIFSGENLSEIDLQWLM